MLLAQIVGYPGAGKTHLCETLRRLYGDKLTVVDTDDAVGDIRTFVDEISSRSMVPVVAIGTFGLAPDQQPDGYPVFASHFYWWMNVPLNVCMERALKRQIQVCQDHVERFVALQHNQSTQETSEWLNEYMNMKHRGSRWEGLRTYFLSRTSDDTQESLFEERTADDILAALCCALGHTGSELTVQTK